MKLLPTIFLALVVMNNAPAQSADIAKNLGLYVFPAKDQTKEQQEQDEFTCYKWAKEQSGVDPMNPPDIQAQEVETGPDGTVVRKAAKGAAMGAAIGAITGDAGEGAAIGATAGGFAGLAQRRGQNQAKEQQAQANAQQQEQALMNNFKKAFSVCIEGKGYTVK